MKKLIDIPDSIVRELKVLAAKNDTDLKNYIQDLITRQYEFTHKTEMACYGIGDGQSMRFIYNYLFETYEGLKNEKFDFGKIEFQSPIEFAEIVKDACDLIIDSTKEAIEDGKYK